MSIKKDEHARLKWDMFLGRPKHRDHPSNEELVAVVEWFGWDRVPAAGQRYILDRLLDQHHLGSGGTPPS